MNEKVKAILAYVFGWIGGLVVLFAVKDNTRDTKFHAAQSIVISVAYSIILMIYNLIPIGIPLFTAALWVVYIIAIVMGIIKACKEEDPELPVVGNIAKSIFGKQIGQ